jgi:hypothetical protein
MSGFFSLAAMHTKLPQCKPASLSRILCVITVAKKEDAAPARKHTPAQGHVGGGGATKLARAGVCTSWP